MEINHRSLVINNNYTTNSNHDNINFNLKTEQINLDSRDFLNDPVSSMVASSSAISPVTTTKIVTIPRVAETFSSDLKVSFHGDQFLTASE
jgi:hypothetical protein